MPHTVQLTARARLEVDDILEWLGKFSTESSQRCYDAFSRLIEELRDNPFRYPQAPESADVGVDIRETTIGTVRIIHVLRAIRDRLAPEEI